MKHLKKHPQYQEEHCNQMMHKCHELLKEVDIHKNQIIESQNDSHTTSCFLVDIHIYYYTEFFQKINKTNIGNKQMSVIFQMLFVSFFVHWKNVRFFQ